MDGQTERMLHGLQYEQLLEKKIARVREKYGLRKVDVEVLYYLSKSGENNTSRDIKANMKLTKGHISQSVARLRRMKFIDFLPDKDDRRCVHLVLTAHADELVQEITNVWTELNRIALEGVTEEEKLVLERVALKIKNNIEKALNN